MPAQASQPKYVFAHLIVGNTYGWTQANWASDIQLAAAAGIDGFALNIGGDSYTTTQLNNAFAAANAQKNFTLFISFDYAAYAFTSQSVITYINTYKTQASYFLYNGAPLASTFEGVPNAADWPGIKAATGCFFVPDWTSAKGTPSTFANVDGALSWDVWPNGPNPMALSIDTAWQSVLGSKAYMMGVSPWFYTNIPGGASYPAKNWLWRGDSLWHDRWQQVLEINPAFVEILTWNDYGESHYIGPVHAGGIPAGDWYTTGMAHDAWRELLPYYIHQYKSGNTTQLPVTQEKIIYTHKQNPGASGSTDGTTGNNPSYGQTAYPPSQVSLDAISLDVIVKAPSTVTVKIGGNAATTLTASTVGVNHFSVPFNGQTGTVVYTLKRGGATIMTTTGASINATTTTGNVNWNAITGSSS
ncbi:hypothetical protein MMC19_003452 [Ptychographa xylographoides]|nr:hypothetical protein [Ptychographa xylographoides]